MISPVIARLCQSLFTESRRDLLSEIAAGAGEDLEGEVRSISAGVQLRFCLRRVSVSDAVTEPSVIKTSSCLFCHLSGSFRKHVESNTSSCLAKERHVDVFLL